MRVYAFECWLVSAFTWYELTPQQNPGIKSHCPGEIPKGKDTHPMLPLQILTKKTKGDHFKQKLHLTENSFTVPKYQHWLSPLRNNLQPA